MAEYTIDKFTFGGNTYNIEQPTIPTNVSAFINDAGYLTAHQTIPVTDVRLNGSSIVSSGIANITDASGNLSISGNITTNGHSTQIGDTTDTNSSSVNVTSGSTWKTISAPTLEISEGTWIIFATISVPGNTTGDRGLGITYNSQTGNIVISRHVQRAAAGSSIAAVLNTSTIVNVPEAGRTYQIELFQNSGSTQSVTGYLRAVRIA